VSLSTLIFIFPSLVSIVRIFLEPKYSTPKTLPFTPFSETNFKFSGLTPKKFSLESVPSFCSGIFNDEDEDASLQDSGFNLVSDQDTTTTTDGDTTTVSTPTVADPVTTPVNQETTQPSTPSTPSTPTPPSTPPAQNDPPQQGGYGGY